ncbi:MAG TPA: maleylacetoacetate isomerase [Rhizomicrobium sp.]|jgi:maleylacetoacetate isomerase|nr:maleylacetoacetate isomerase [Rhizomicrobium sp.]
MSAAPDLALYSYFRSSAAFRVRIALNLKGLSADTHFVHLLKDGGQQHGEAYREINPQEIVPTLVAQGQALGQSLAIIEYLDEIVPEPALLPSEPLARARVRQLALLIACDIHPLNNLRVLRQLKQLGIEDDARLGWQRHWIGEGFRALEALLAGDPARGAFCHGDKPTLADLCLIPQMTNARRVELDLAPFPTLLAIEAAAYRLPAFVTARPENQADAE